MKTKIKAIILTAAVMPVTSFADIKPAAMFTDHMVIQRDTQAPVWGRGEAGEKVTVTASWGATAATTVDKDGKWKVVLKTPAAGGPHTLTLKGNNTIEIKDLLSGEVWFCSGQSNMDFILSQLTRTNPQRTEEKDMAAAEYIKKEIATAKDNQLRQFTVERNTSPTEPLDTLKGSWIDSAPANNANFSATAYFFARELRNELKVPVGIIKCAWGGTRVEAWMPADAFQGDKEMETYFQHVQASLQKAIDNWDPEKVKPNTKGRKPQSPASNQQAPSTLFNAMVHPVAPYAIKGTIWYQGESNSNHNNEHYTRNFQAMITAWRSHWGQGDFPFYFAQLASFRAPAKEPIDQDSWASICDQQRRTLSLKNTGMAVLNDIGEAKDIHPHNKIDVGKRLALWALKNDYGQKTSACSGPLYESHAIKGNQVAITFTHADSGLMTATKTGLDPAQESKAALKGFQICGNDRQWHWAEARISGANTVIVSSKEVSKPTIVRYAWATNPEGVNLYNKEGLPTSIFTTEKEIPVYKAPPKNPKK